MLNYQRVNTILWASRQTFLILKGRFPSGAGLPHGPSAVFRARRALVKGLKQQHMAWNGYGSIPIHTIFRGMNIHLPAVLWFTRYQGFDTLPNQDLDGDYPRYLSYLDGFSHFKPWFLPSKSRKTWWRDWVLQPKFRWNHPWIIETVVCYNPWASHFFWSPQERPPALDRR